MAKIAPLPAPVADYALIGIPKREVLREKATIGGSPAARTWLVTVLVREFLSIAKALEKRAVFRKVMVQTQPCAAAPFRLYFQLVPSAAERA